MNPSPNVNMKNPSHIKQFLNYLVADDVKLNFPAIATGSPVRPTLVTIADRASGFNTCLILEHGTATVSKTAALHLAKLGLPSASSIAPPSHER